VDDGVHVQREICLSWTKDGLVWLWPDDGYGTDPDLHFFQHFQHVFSTFSATAKKNSEANPEPDSGKEEGSSIKNNKDYLFSANRKKRGSTPDQNAGSLSLTLFSIC
jgi:hypothetical protein